MKHFFLMALVVVAIGSAKAQTFGSTNLNLLGLGYTQMWDITIEDQGEKIFSYGLNWNHPISNKIGLGFGMVNTTARNYFYEQVTRLTAFVNIEYYWHADEKTQLYSGGGIGFVLNGYRPYFGEVEGDITRNGNITILGARGTIYKNLGYFSEITFGAKPLLMTGVTLKY